MFIKKQNPFYLIITFFLVVTLCECNNLPNTKEANKSNDIVILYTNDDHCYINDNLGYESVASYKKLMQQQNKYVTLVNNGDFLQGGIFGSFSNGQYIIDIMNNVGYDYVTFGNHEFDYGMDVLQDCIKKSNFTYLVSNISYSGTKSETFINYTKPYTILEYGDIKVAFIGVSTPTSLYSSTPVFFMENDNFVFDFGNKDDENSMINTVQKYVDICRNEGANYVIIMSHLGDEIVEQNCSSINLIQNTIGIDVVLDGHSHSQIESKTLKNKENKDVILTSTGSAITNIGKLVLSPNGTITTTLVNDYHNTDKKVSSLIEKYNKDINQKLSQVICQSSVDLLLTDENGIRLVRNRECNIGNFVADSLRIVGDADVGIVNGGNLRRDLKKGKITIKDLKELTPFGTYLCVKKVTGQDIADVLEFSCKNVEAQYFDENKNSKGEFGGFLHVSGLKFTIDTSIPSPVVLTTSGEYSSINGTRRVSDIKILSNGVYEDIDMNKQYLLSGLDYVLNGSGDGNSVLKKCKIVKDNIMLDYEVTMKYIKEILNGDLSQYAKVDNRITIK